MLKLAQISFYTLLLLPVLRVQFTAVIDTFLDSSSTCQFNLTQRIQCFHSSKHVGVNLNNEGSQVLFGSAKVVALHSSTGGWCFSGGTSRKDGDCPFTEWLSIGGLTLLGRLSLVIRDGRWGSMLPPILQRVNHTIILRSIQGIEMSIAGAS